jgi:hypothetical protein
LEVKKAVATEMKIGDEVVFVKRMHTKTEPTSLREPLTYINQSLKLNWLNLNTSVNGTIHKNPKKRRTHNGT